MRLLFFMLSLTLAFQIYCQADIETEIGKIKRTIQDKQFENAVKLIDSQLESSEKQQDFLLYLKGLSLFYNDNFPDAINSCDKIIQQHEKSPWYRKAIFLKAQCHIQLKQFEEAERIYNSEARRLLSNERKEEIAKIYFRFAEEVSKKPGKDELDAPPPNYRKAYELYKKAIDLEIERDIKDEALFRLGRMMHLEKDYGQAIQDYREYLNEFDPNWLGALDSPRRQMQKSEKQFEAGKHIYEARYYLAECQLSQNQDYWARINLEDLLELIPKSEPDYEKIVRDSRLLLIKTYNIPQPKDENELTSGVKTAKSFLADFPNDPRLVKVAYDIGQSYEKLGWSSEAISAYRDYIKQELPEFEQADSLSDEYKIDESPAELFHELKMSATYKIGKILFAQKEYTEAIEIWNQYISQFPNGPKWTEAQQGIVNAEFKIGVELVAEKKYDEAIQTWDEFLEKHPLDSRSRQIMFIYGQIYFHKEDYQKAIAEWEKLVNKYPGTEESSLALFRIGKTYEEKLGSLDKALESYRKLNWGSWERQAKERIKAMTEKNLRLVTERIFRTNETAKVKVSLRNIEKLTVNLYKLDLEAYWRKMHLIRGVENLDIALIAPDKTWEYETPDYQKFKPFEQKIEIPMDGPGVYAVNVGDEDLEATTLVIRSDIDMILKTSRKEALIFAEDMLKRQPASEAKVLVSDRNKVICEGKTDQNGIFHKKLDNLKNASNVTAFVVKDGNVSSELLDVSSLGLSKGLSPRGYIYTDKPAYRPGQKVSVKGIIRDVKDGAYLEKVDDDFKISIMDSQGRLLKSEKAQLSKFGTFHTEIILDSNAPEGEYRIVVEHKEEKNKSFTGTFQVQKFHLEKMKLSLEFPRDVYFRGEVVEATFVATYYYGQPVVDKVIRYTLPDGRSFTKATDSEGKVKTSFDTTPMEPGKSLSFRGSIEGENVSTSDNVYLALRGFSIDVKPSSDVVISGEPFDVLVKTLDAQEKPIGKELILTVYRQVQKPAHPIFSQVPWIEQQDSRQAENKVEEHKIVTDEKTGEGKISLALVKGGEYNLRVSGTDRFGQPVVASDIVSISDDEDDIKLRIFADKFKLKVGETEMVKIHSRVPSSLALVTFEGEGIIDHKIISLEKGMNELEFDVGNEYFPNFHISVSVIDDSDMNQSKTKTPSLRTTGKDFTVERELMVSLNIEKFYQPGEEAEVEINTADQIGNPVEAELSLALVDEALFAIFPDNVKPITEFFNEGIFRDAAMHTTSSCSFRYSPSTRRVLKEVLEEEKRLEMEEEYAERFGDITHELNGLARAGVRLREEAALKQKVEELSLSSRLTFDKKDAAGQKAVKAREPVRKLGALASTPMESKYAGYATTELAAGRRLSASAAAPIIRKEFIEAGYWIPSVVTDMNGKAVARISMPEKTTQWRLTARGCTVETLAGQTKVNTITRKDFFLDIKLPSIVTQGDKVRILARIHNLTDFTGNAVLNLKLNVDGEELYNSDAEDIKIDGKGTTEYVFDETTIPAGQELQVEISAQAGEMTDGISSAIPIRPWGMEIVDNQGNVSSGDETIFLELPEQKYNSKRLMIKVGPSVNRLIFELAMNNYTPLEHLRTINVIKIPPVPGDTGSDLLAAAYAIGYLKEIGGSEFYSNELIEYAKGVVASLVVNQKDDGGWSWCYNSENSDAFSTSRTLWALAEAQKQGIVINPQTIEKAMSYIKEAFSRAGQNDNETKAVILHALSRLGEADFAYANRLYRNRNQMSTSALAYTALIFANLNRNEIGGEIIDVLEKKIKTNDNMVWWLTEGNSEWTASEVETTALSLLAVEAIRPNSPLIKQAVEYLLSKRTFYGFSPYKAKAPAVAALAIYYGKTQFVKSDYKLAISVNGEEVKSVQVNAEQQTMLIYVPSKLIQDGKNRVDFHMEGNGSYAYTATLSGFSPEFKDPKSWEKPFIRTRRYYHAPLKYKGRQIASSTTEITQLPDGERTYVSVDIREEYSNRYLIVDEYLPAGTMLVDDSISGNYQHYEVGDGMITFYYPPGRRLRDYRYQLVSYAPGSYRVMPTVIRDAMRPGQMRIGEQEDSKETVLTVLAPGEKSKEEYQINDMELYGLGKAYFDDGKYEDALPLLTKLYERNSEYNQREVARMLLWIHTEEEYFEAKKVIEYFEILRERFPELYIPFEKIIVVGQAYREIKEFERAYLVYKATIDASFVNDSNVSAVLEDEGQFLSSVDFQENLWREYPDSPLVVSSYFAISQAIYSKSSEAEKLTKSKRYSLLPSSGELESQEKISKLDMLKETALMLSQFLTLYPNDPLADDASFSMANVLLDLEAFQNVVELCNFAQKRFEKSEYLSSFQYVEALGLFSQRKYDSAIQAAKIVAEGKSKDKDLARYIIGQIYHAQGKPEIAIDWYQKVEEIYPDARESISYFEEKRISLDEVHVVRPNQDAKIKLKYRNVKEAELQIYKVDLMKLYLREKNLSKIRQVQLAGIEPELSKSIILGDGKDYIDKEHEVELALKDENAYLIICRGDDIFTSGLVLITPLELEVQEEPVSGRVRVNVKDVVSETYKEGIHVKVIGSDNKEFISGETDLRGIFIADNIRGKATVIARQDNNLYAFYRGKQWLGAPETVEGIKQVRPAERGRAEQQARYKADYRANIEIMNQAIQGENVKRFNKMRRGVQKGVQVQEAR